MPDAALPPTGICPAALAVLPLSSKNHAHLPLRLPLAAVRCIFW
jgi:hypothetical protein